MRSPPASTWPKWMIPTSSTPSTALQLARRSSSARSGARVQFHPLLDGSSTSASRPAPKVTSRDDPRDTEGGADDRRPHRHRRATLAWVEGHRDAELAGGREAAAGEQGRGGPPTASAPVRPVPIRVARRAPNAALAPSRSTSSSAPMPSTSTSTSIPGFGSAFLAWPIGMNRRAADREHDGKPGTGHDDRQRREDQPPWCTRSGSGPGRAAPGGRRPPRPCDGAGPARRRRAQRGRPPTRTPPARRPAPSCRPPPSLAWSERSLMNTSSRPKSDDGAVDDRPEVVTRVGGDLEGGSEPAGLSPVLLVEGRACRRSR